MNLGCLKLGWIAFSVADFMMLFNSSKSIGA